MSTPEPKAGLSLVGEPKVPERDTLDRPCFAVYDRPVFKEGKAFREGTWYHGVKHSGPEDDPVPFDYWICSPLHVEAETVNTEDGSIGRLLSFRYRGKRIEWVMPMEALAGKADEVLKALMRQGLAIEYHQRRHVAPYLASYHAPARVIATTTKPGWHESGAFVLPSRVLGGDNVRYQDSGRAVNLFTTKGTLANWQAQIAPRCLGNPVLILSVCCALAGPLLTKLGVNGGGIHLVGDSSSGKSLAQLIAASVWGNPGTFAASWDVSKGGVEIEAASRNDTVLILDEIKRADPKRVQEMAYAIANGMGKSTMTREREGRAKLTWRVLALSSGERSLSEHAAIAGNGAHAGAELRMVDVNAGTRPFRAFDDVQGLTGQEFHRLLTDAVGQDYGHLGPAFVESLLKTPEDLLERFRELRATFRTESSQAGRVADRFALMALAGELASERQLLGWPTGTAGNACRQLFGEWLARMGDGNAEERQILRGIADFIALHGDSRFSWVHAEHAAVTVRDRAGFYELIDDRRLYLFNAPALLEAAAGYGKERILRALVEANALAKVDEEARTSRRTKRYRTPGGGNARFYVIDPERLDTEGESQA
ncbi:DUF927 domain-containing protein [Pseudomonas oryzihabitans]|uniref:DUF927 domain-containing protein n=1 Tax=Pseudomonas oryzihabitans TaxID=47885 RepID=UPI002894B68C|nr:DUF927 domain-containing protein [Pseudomonas oryzihabitans]MDT3721530.1 DUF927 domain-containing protein [Pseudomonas oryzihabitans]